MNNKRKGRYLEMLINDSLKFITSEKLGYFIKSPIPNKAIPFKGGYKFIYSAKALCDFLGIYKERFVLIEAKEIANKSFDLKRIKGHQLEQLIEIYSNGGISYIIFNIKIESKIVLLKIKDFVELLNSTTKKSIRIEKLLEKGITLQILNNRLELITTLNYDVEEENKK